MQPIDNDDREASFLRRHRIKLTVAALSVGGVVLLVAFGSGPDRPKFVAAPPQIINIIVPPPPPPPPPPPRQREPRPEQAQDLQMVAAEASNEPDEAPSESPPAGDAPLGTGVVGDGPADGFGLGTAPGGGGGFYGGTTRASGTGSALGRYGYQVQTSIQSALSAHPNTRSLVLDGRLRVWVDANDRIERVELAGTDVATDQITAVREALFGLQLRQSPPAGTPMPVVLSLRARRAL